jgi:lipopolysaccharide/colanic/teichoic acid biosynthesis glycosyltransferase
MASSFTLAVKRATDVAGAAAALVALSPVLLAAAAAIRITMGAPVLYRQQRPGLHERPIRIWKFRTMRDTRDERGRLLPDGERLTPLGRFLREYSVDELPQFFNVLCGDLSLVGPRPLLTRYLPRYTTRQRRRHRVMPGMTGWAQVNGRNAIDWESRLEMDVWYADHLSIALDVRIILLTIVRLLQRRDVRPGGGSELDEFWGAAGAPAEGPRALPVEEEECVSTDPARLT